jgi:hypothetical protein
MRGCSSRRARKVEGFAVSLLIMVLLWLADIPYRRERAFVCTATGAKRQRLTLPLPQWLSDRFEIAGVNVNTVEWNGSFQIVVRALLNVSRGEEWRGSLTPWDSEAYVMHEYYGFPSDAYSIGVDGFLKLDRPVPLLHVWDDKGFLRTPQLHRPMFKPHGFTHGEAATMTGTISHASADVQAQASVAEAVRRWGLQAADLDGALVLGIPNPIVELLLLHRQWHTLLLRATWKLRPFADYPADAWVDQIGREGGADAARVAHVEVTYSKVDALMRNLRRWAKIITAAAEDEEEAAAEENAFEMAMPSPWFLSQCSVRVAYRTGSFGQTRIQNSDQNPLHFDLDSSSLILHRSRSQAAGCSPIIPVVPRARRSAILPCSL